MSINLINYALAKKDWEKAYEDLKVLENGGRNLVVLKDLSVGRYIDERNGNIRSTEDHAATDFFEVSPLTDYVMSGKYNVVQIRFVVYDENKNYIDGTLFRGDRGKYQVYKTPANSVFMRVSAQFSGENVSPYETWKIEKGNKPTDWTPAPEDINAHPFVAELAETVYRSKQNEERIRNLENAITALGGGS